MSSYENLKEIIQEISNKKEIDFIKAKSDFNFKTINKQLNEIFEILDLVSKNMEFFDYESERIRQNIIQTLGHLNGVLIRIENFAPLKSTNPSNERNSLEGELITRFEQIKSVLFDKFMIYHIRNSVINSKENSEIKKKLNEALEEVDQSLGRIKEKEEAITGLLETGKNSIRDIGITGYEKVFQDESEENSSLAKKWFWSFISFIILGAVLLVFLFNSSYEKIITNPELYLQYALTKIFIISVFSTITYQIIKNYSAHMHLFKLNRHKQNCLRVFETFVKSTNDPEVKDVILQQATNAIFEFNDTGYNQSSKESSGSIGLVNIVDKVSKLNGKS